MVDLERVWRMGDETKLIYIIKNEMERDNEIPRG